MHYKTHIFFDLTAPNSEILKNQLLDILTGFKKRPMDILKTSQSEVRKLTSLERPQ